MSLDMTGGKELTASTHCTLALEGRRPSKQLEHLFEKSKLGDDKVLLEEKRIEEEKKLKEYKEASKEVHRVQLSQSSCSL